MTLEELKAFEMWLLKAYEMSPSVPFPILAQVLKLVRADVRLTRSAK